jgi:hypothetical protein
MHPVSQDTAGRQAQSPPNEDRDAAELKRLIHPPAGGAVAARRQREVGPLDDVERVIVLRLTALMTCADCD